MILFFGNFSGSHPGVPLVLLTITLLTSGIITSPLLWLIMAGLLGLGAWQVQQQGLWPTLQQLIRGLQGVPQQQPQRPEQQARRQEQPQQGGRQTRAQRKQRFEEVARAVQALPMEEFVTRQDLERCSLHTLREKMQERGLEVRGGLERREAVEQVLAADAGNSTSAACSICCEDYASGEVVRRLRCAHKFHLECIDRWFLSSTDYTRPVACPVCNAPIL